MHIGPVRMQDSRADERLAAFNTEAGSEPALKLKHWQHERDGEVRHDVIADVPARCALVRFIR